MGVVNPEGLIRLGLYLYTDSELQVFQMIQVGSERLQEWLGCLIARGVGWNPTSVAILKGNDCNIWVCCSHNV